MVSVSLYGPHGVLDRRPADDEKDAVRVLVEIAHERGIIRIGEWFEVQALRDVEPPR